MSTLSRQREVQGAGEGLLGPIRRLTVAVSLRTGGCGDVGLCVVYPESTRDVPDAAALGEDVDPLDLLTRFLSGFRSAYRPRDPGFAAAVIERWSAVSATLGAGERVALTRLSADYDALLKQKGTAPTAPALAGNGSVLPVFARAAFAAMTSRSSMVQIGRAHV